MRHLVSQTVVYPDVRPGRIAHNADNLGTGPNQNKPTGAHAYALIPQGDPQPEIRRAHAS